MARIRGQPSGELNLGVPMCCLLCLPYVRANCFNRILSCFQNSFSISLAFNDGCVGEAGKPGSSQFSSIQIGMLHVRNAENVVVKMKINYVVILSCSGGLC